MVLTTVSLPVATQADSKKETPKSQKTRPNSKSTPSKKRSVKETREQACSGLQKAIKHPKEFWAARFITKRNMSLAAMGITGTGLMAYGAKTLEVPPPEVTSEGIQLKILDRELNRNEGLAQKANEEYQTLQAKLAKQRQFLARAEEDRFFALRYGSPEKMKAGIRVTEDQLYRLATKESNAVLRNSQILLKDMPEHFDLLKAGTRTAVWTGRSAILAGAVIDSVLFYLIASAVDREQERAFTKDFFDSTSNDDLPLHLARRDSATVDKACSFLANDKERAEYFADLDSLLDELSDTPAGQAATAEIVATLTPARPLFLNAPTLTGPLKSTSELIQ